MRSMTRTPDQLADALNDAVSGRGDATVAEVVFEIMDDVLDSVRLAMQNDPRVDDFAAHDVMTVVNDYISNHYGEL